MAAKATIINSKEKVLAFDERDEVTRKGSK
jgi:hypothetical protein